MKRAKVAQVIFKKESKIRGPTLPNTKDINVV